MNQTAFDLRLVERYDRTGPRYTSYPTAAQFSENFDGADYLAAVQSSREARTPLSLYLHLPFCASPCFYCGCTRIITRSHSIADGYLRRLQIEASMVGALFSGRGPVQQLHLGGGTPTYLNLEQLTLVMDTMDRAFGLGTAADREYSIEIDPRTLEPQTIPGLAALGFNRMSIGVQDFDTQVQLAVNRLQSYGQTEQALEQARQHGFGSVSVDLIYGLPLQTAESFGRTLDQVIQLAPDRISAYSYAHLPQLFRGQTQIEDSQLPSPRQKLGLLELTVTRLEAAGYVYIGMDHFARPQDELARALHDGTLQRNFQGYSTRGGADLIGLGLSAISRIADTYSQNAKTLDTYYAPLDGGRLSLARGLRLNADDLLRREVIESIMCRGRVDWPALEQRHGILHRSYFADALAALAPLSDDGLVEFDEHELHVTPKGRFLLRAVAMPFDAHLRAAPAGSAVPHYSKVI